CWASSVLSTVMASPLSSLLLPGSGALRPEPAFPQIRAALPRRLFPLLLPPLADPVMMTGEQYLRHRAAIPILRPRVVRIFEEAVLETFLRERRLVAHHARQQPHASVDERDRRRLAAREDEIAEAQLLDAARLDHPLVHPLVAAADQVDT